MNDDIVTKWAVKADNDFKTGMDEFNSPDPTYDTVCFHMQQCAEKYLKAFLIFRNKEISKTHNITLLLQQCAMIDKDFEQFINEETAKLTYYAVEARYPDDFYMPTYEEALQAMDIAEEIRSLVRTKIIKDAKHKGRK